MAGEVEVEPRAAEVVAMEVEAMEVEEQPQPVTPVFFGNSISHFASVLGDSTCVLFDFPNSTKLHQDIPTIWRLEIFGIDNLFVFSTRNLQITFFGGFLLISRVLLKILVGKLCFSFVLSICVN